MANFLFGFFLFSSCLFSDEFGARFESEEHVHAGEHIKLISKSNRFKLKNGLKLSFSEIIAMPDFYGVVGEYITNQEQFVAAFETLANDPNSLSEAEKIRNAIQSNIPRDQQHVTWNCLTGGACSGATWWLTPGRYLLLAEQDFDHFGANAVVAYQAGHEAAIQRALIAGRTQDEDGLSEAYALEAFACHFLTDRFSAGHIRVPRAELPQNVTPAVLGSLLVTFMHDEESKFGLHVHNQRGDSWIAYGDGYYLDARNSMNRLLTEEAMQLSVDQVSNAFLKGAIPREYPQLELIPEADEQAPNCDLDLSPLFYFEQQTGLLKRRENLSKPSDCSWTVDWYGWSTLAALKLSNTEL